MDSGWASDQERQAQYTRIKTSSGRLMAKTRPKATWRRETSESKLNAPKLIWSRVETRAMDRSDWLKGMGSCLIWHLI